MMARMGILVLAVALMTTLVSSSKVESGSAQSGPIWFAAGLLLGSADNSGTTPTSRPVPSCSKPIMILRAFGLKSGKLRVNFTSTLPDAIYMTALNPYGYPVVEDRWMRPTYRGEHWIFRQTEISVDKRYSVLTIIAIDGTNPLCRLSMDVQLKPTEKAKK